MFKLDAREIIHQLLGFTTVWGSDVGVNVKWDEKMEYVFD